MSWRRHLDKTKTARQHHPKPVAEGQKKRTNKEAGDSVGDVASQTTNTGPFPEDDAGVEALR
jgi:hypothetical protein